MGKPCNIMIDSDTLSNMLICSFRYSLGRTSYVTAECASWIKNWWHVLHPALRAQMHDDIRKAIASGKAGMDCDIEVWRNILALPEVDDIDNKAIDALMAYNSKAKAH